MTAKSETVKVVVRCRPLSSKEVETGKYNVVFVDESRGMISVKNPRPEKSSQNPVREFTFDHTYGQTSKQDVIFEQSAQQIVMSVLEGYNGTIFAYGQTGTGKTFTMEGNNKHDEGEQSPEHLRGIVPRAIDFIFKAIDEASKNKQYLVRASFLELYNEELIDLFAKPEKLKQGEKKKKLEIHQRPNEGIKVMGLSEFMIEDRNELSHKYDYGKGHRKVAHTEMNAESSRSHSIFSIIVENQETIDDKVHTRLGKLNLVDLAGSERQSKTGVSGIESVQAIKINLSLTTLGMVIQNLVNPASMHIPYRDSQLTRLLQDSLGGNTKTVMIANVGPAEYNYEETMSTLKYAHRAKSIKNEVRINEDPKDALLRQFKDEIEHLRKQLAEGMGGAVVEGGTVVVEKIVRIEEGEDIQEIEQKFQKEQLRLTKQFEDEKKKIYLNKNFNDEERDKLLKQIQKKEEQQQLFKNNKEQLLKKLKKMEVKLLSGHEQAEKARVKEQQFHRKQRQLEDKIKEEERIKQKLKEKEEAIMNEQKIYSSLVEENEDKGKRIKHLFSKYKQIESENKELDEMYVAEIDELQDRRRILQKQLKLKNLILEYFIPSKELDSLQDKAFWSDERDEWMLPNLQFSGNSLRLSGQYKQPEREKNELEELTRNELENHPNMYFAYTEDGIAREMDLNPNEKKKNLKPKKPGSARKRPSSKRKA